MKIGLIIAVESELQAFLRFGGERKEHSVSNRKIYETTISGHDIFAMQSGCGEIDAAAATQLLITKFDCELILNFGVTGALDPSLRVEDLFVVRKVCHYEFDTSCIDPVKEHQYEEFPDEFIPMDDALVEFTKSVCPDIREAVVASGSRFIEKKEDKRELAALGCNICEMEIAAIARVCYLSQVRCLSIKCISDTYDGNGGDFWTNVERSAKRAFDVILQLLNHLS